MKKIGNLLLKFKKLLDIDEENKKAITEAIFKHTKEILSEKDIKIKGKILFIRQNPYVKKEIAVKKSKILKTLKESLVNLLIEDIK